MITSNQKTSLLVPFQLPEYIRDNPDYSNFVTFLQAYYQWMEQSGNVTDGSKNLLNYQDIDNTTSEFLNYFINDFLPYFPEDALISKEKAVKVARQLYKSKGTPASYQFLFRILYNSDFDYINTGDVTLKASDGTWFVAKSLKLATDDTRFLELNTNDFGNYRAFGETSKSFATIEYVTFAINKTEVFVSNIERLFESGEMIRIVDANNQDVIINGSNLRAKLVGQISQVNINPNNRGLFYNPGDPVIVYNGLNQTITNPSGASAQVGSTTSGSVQKINVNNGGYGYTVSNTAIIFSNLNSGSQAPIAIVGSVSSTGQANVSFIPEDTISLKRLITIGNSNYHFANQAVSNANTSLANAFTFLSFSTFPISSVLVENGGGGITSLPTITADSEYVTDLSGTVGHLASLGILAPIQITNGGTGYRANDVINFIGGTGYGAHANVTNVDANGVITSVSYVYKPGEVPNHYPLGGLGYQNGALPSLTVTSANTQASNASLYVPCVLGTSAVFSTSVDRAGSITTINVTNPGEDYIAIPNVSLKVQDIVVSNVSLSYFPDPGDIIYQGGTGPNNATYFAYYQSITQLSHNNDPTKSLWNLRVFNYSSQPNPNLVLKSSDADSFANAIVEYDDTDYLINYNMANTSYSSNTFFNSSLYGEYSNGGNPAYNTQGVINYGDGTALATAKFLNGLVIGQGQYIDSKGQPSGFSVLQSPQYNNFTYQITVNKEIQKYRNILLNLLHPAGMNIVGRYAIGSESDLNFGAEEIINTGHTLAFAANAPSGNVVISTTLSNPGTNILQFNNLNNDSLSNIITSYVSTISLTSGNGDNVYGLITGVDVANNKATLSSNVFLSYANIAYVSANVNTTTININSITNAFYIVNNKIFTTNTPLAHMVYAGDTIQFGNSNGVYMGDSANTYTVASVNAVSNTITTTSNIVTSVANTLIAVNRRFVAGWDGDGANNAQNIIIYNTISVSNLPYITDQSGNLIITEDGDFILLG